LLLNSYPSNLSMFTTNQTATKIDMVEHFVKHDKVLFYFKTKTRLVAQTL